MESTLLHCSLFPFGYTFEPLWAENGIIIIANRRSRRQFCGVTKPGPRIWLPWSPILQWQVGFDIWVADSILMHFGTNCNRCNPVISHFSPSLAYMTWWYWFSLSFHFQLHAKKWQEKRQGFADNFAMGPCSTETRNGLCQFRKSLRRCRRGKQGVQRDAEGVRESIRHPINVISSFSFMDLQILGLETAFLDTTVIMNIDEQHA